MRERLRLPSPDEDAKTPVRTHLKRHAAVLGIFVAGLWLLEIVDAVIFGQGLNGLGIRPRSMEGLRGIFLAPLLHGGFDHLIANTLPLLTLGWFVMLRRTRDFFYVGFIVTVIGGLGVWLIGSSSSVHIGASILIFGFLGYLMLRGFFDRKVLSILGSLVVIAAYGGLLYGVLPGQAGISWEGHLFGFVGGIASAYALRSRGETPKPALAASSAANATRGRLRSA